jgi:hypothetical protein
VKHRTQSALLVAGAAAGVAALAWVGKRRHMGATPSLELDEDTLFGQRDTLPGRQDTLLGQRDTLPDQEDEQTVVRRRPEPTQPDPSADDYLALITADLLDVQGPELPIGRSADPAIDGELRSSRGQDETSGAALFSEPEPVRPISEDISLEQIWDAGLSSDENPPAEGYDAVAPEDLGSVWLERATETAREDRVYASDPADPVTLDDLLVSEATRASALPLDAEEAEDEAAAPDEEQDPNDVQEDDLDIDEDRDSRP